MDEDDEDDDEDEDDEDEDDEDDDEDEDDEEDKDGKDKDEVLMRFVVESKKELREIFITDFAGKILQKLGDPGKKGRWQVDIGQYPSGTYLVKYITTDNKWGAEKVILLR